MLTIRKDQMAAFEVKLARKFRAQLRNHARNDLAAETEKISDLDLETMIDGALERGKGYGVTSERDVSLFFDLMILKGRGFDQDRKLSWIRKILTDETMEGSAKMNAIYMRIAALENREAMPDVDG